MSIPIYCGLCKRYIPIKTPNRGLCSAPTEYFEVCFGDKCYYVHKSEPNELFCKDCARCGNDTACFSVEPEDRACRDDGTLCGGFISKFSHEFDLMLWKLFCNHEGDKGKVLNDIAERMMEFELPCEAREQI